MGRGRAWLALAFAVAVAVMSLPDDTVALDTTNDIVCGDHEEGCHKLQQIISNKDRNLKKMRRNFATKLKQHRRLLETKDKQLETKDKQLEDQSHLLAFARRLLGSAPPAANKALVKTTQRTEACVSEQPWDLSCSQERSRELGQTQTWSLASVLSAVEGAMDGGGTSPATTTDSDPGAAARCSNVRAGTTAPGALSCSPKQDKCHVPDGFTQKRSICQAYWGGGDAIVDAVQCPDGGIHWQGVFMFSANYPYCVAWDSVAARLGLQECNRERTICTELTARHLNRMSRSAGVLIMKRMTCDDEGTCAVFKAGKCFDVGKNMFANTRNDFDNMRDSLGEQSQAWASLVVEQLKAGTATACGTTTKDHKIATAGILGY